MSIKYDGYSLAAFAKEKGMPVFKQFMSVENVDGLKKKLQMCIDAEFYEGAAVIRDLLEPREGKVEIKNSSNTYSYF